MPQCLALCHYRIFTPSSLRPSLGCLLFLLFRCCVFPHAPNLWKYHVSYQIEFSRGSRDQPSTQYGHNRCALFTFPQAEHLFRAVTSCNAFPAKNRWRFFRWEVFFFGTARNIDSHSPAKMDGTSKRKASGMTKGCCRMGRRSWLRNRGAVVAWSGNRTAEETSVAENRGWKGSCRRAIL